jgi:GntR family transcriptional regulator
MRSFEERGLIVRRQGVGTYVTHPPQVIETGLEVLESIESLAARMGLKVEMGGFDVEARSLLPEDNYDLGLPVGAPIVVVSRVILAEGRPVAYLVDVLPQDVLHPEDLSDGFSGSVLDLLLRRGKPALHRSWTEITAVSASPKIARHLRIQRGDVLLRLEACLYAADGRVVDHSESYFLPGTFRFRITRRVRGTS